MSNLAELSKPEAVERLTRATSTLARMRAQSQEVTSRAQRLVGMVAGGALSGALQAKLPTIPGTNVDSGQVVGGVLAAVAISGWVKDPTTNDFLLGVSGGLLAAEAAQVAQRAFSRLPLAQTQRAA